jgi:hypothetical protein
MTKQLACTSCRLALLTLLFGTTAQAAVNDSDPYSYDPTFNGGNIIDDRFAGAAGNRYLAQKLVQLTNGNVVVAALVPAAYQSNGANYNLGLVQYGPSGERIGWANPTPAYSYYYNIYIDYKNSNSAAYTAIDDIKQFGNFIYVLTEYTDINNNYIFITHVFTLDGTFVQAFAQGGNLGRDHGVGMIFYTYVARSPSTTYSVSKMILVTSYSGPFGSGPYIAIYRSDVNTDGTLSYDPGFGNGGTGVVFHTFPGRLCDGADCSLLATSVSALRTNTSAPTIYVAGGVQISGSNSDAFVMALEGDTGALSTTFGGASGTYLQPYNLPGSDQFDQAQGIVATTSGNESTDVLYLASSVDDQCGGAATAITKLNGAVIVPGGKYVTMPDASWGVGGTTTFGGYFASNSCAGVVDTRPSALLLDGNRLVVGGTQNAYDESQPMLAIVRASDGALTESASYSAAPWDQAGISALVAAGSGKYTATGTMLDAANQGELVGTFRFSSDRIFGNGFD